MCDTGYVGLCGNQLGVRRVPRQGKLHKKETISGNWDYTGSLSG